MAGGASRRFVILLVGAALILSTLFVLSFRGQPEGVRHPNNVNQKSSSSSSFSSSSSSSDNAVSLDNVDLTGHAIAPKLGNATVKAELGRAAWKLFHTTLARFPEKPTQDEKSALKAYIHLFQRLYPCGECAEHFRLVLNEFPPQVSTRNIAAAWGCHVHNEVNKSLQKEIFDCNNIGDFYDCGCAEDEADAKGKKTEVFEEEEGVFTDEMPEDLKLKITGTNGRGVDEDFLAGKKPIPNHG